MDITFNILSVMIHTRTSRLTMKLMASSILMLIVAWLLSHLWEATGEMAFRTLGIGSALICSIMVLLSFLSLIASDGICVFSYARAKFLGIAPPIFRREPLLSSVPFGNVLMNTFAFFSERRGSNGYCANTPTAIDVRAHVSPSRPAFCRAPRTQKRSTSSSNSSGDDDSGSPDPSDPSQQLIPLAPRSPFLKLKNSASARRTQVNPPLLVGACLDGGCSA